MTAGEADKYIEKVARRESNSQRPGVMYDGETGLTYDGHAIDSKTGKLTGGPRNWSAASKESLDIMMLVKAVQGDKASQLAISRSGRPEDAVGTALDRLGRKIDSYASFNQRYPAFGGFLPWFKVEGKPGERRMVPMADWKNKAPGLDNGQLAWSVYHAARALRASGHPQLAAKYEAQFSMMKGNVVKMFYDPGRQALRAEARFRGPQNRAPRDNEYENNKDNDYYLEDAAEGMAMVHFADLFGNWRSAPGGQAAIWANARRDPAQFATADGRRITVVRGWRFSSHEDWAHLILPINDVPVASTLYANAQRVRTTFAAEGGRPGLFASTHVPQDGDGPTAYENAMGVPSVATAGTAALPVYAPYAAFPLALVNKPLYVTWLKNMLEAPRMFGPNGIGESFRQDGRAIAPLLTWDGKVLPIVAYSGGIAADVRKMLQADGVYSRFIDTVRRDYRKFDTIPIVGTDVPIAPPSAGVAKGSPDFAAR
jgi:hypothetical protein